jgi:hypothetical protein
MSWPSHTDYQDSIQNPHICFEDPLLKTGEVGCDMLGLPRVMSGNFACVYSMTTGGDRWAIRCFVRQVLGQQGRYARLSQNLCGLGLPCMVTFDYILRGIQIKNEWYPIVKMQWVDGLPLNQWVEEKATDTNAMKDIAAKFIVMMKSLRENSLAHGDLQHGNVMVTTNDELRLVDYDGMYTPAFKGKSPELGHANFQHPRRTPDYYCEDLDNFAALVIYMSFLAIAADPAYFKKFYTGDNILLLSSDYRNPGSSASLKALKECKDPKVAQLASLIQRLCLVDIAKVPSLETVVDALEKGTLQQMISNLPDPSAAAAAPAGASDWLASAEPLPSTGSRPSPTGSRPSPPSGPTGTRISPAPAPMVPVSAQRPVTPGAAPKPAAAAAPRPASAPAPAAASKPAMPTSMPKAAAKPASAPTPAAQPAGGGGVPMWVWGAIGAVGIIVALLAYIFSSKK